MNKSHLRGPGAIAVILALTATLAGCSTAPAASPSSAAKPGGIVKASIVIGVGGQLSTADVFTGIDKGFFQKEGLTVTTTTLTAGASAIPQLLNGGLMFAAVDTTTAVSSTQQNVGITAVAPNTVGVPDDDGYAMVVAGANSGINSPKDLEGKKVQVNQLGGTAQALTSASITKDGGDPSKVQFVEIAPPQAIPALQAGRVDAVVLGEPNVTIAKGLGFKAIFNPEQNTVPKLPTFVFVTAASYAKANPQVVAQFQRAILASNQFDNANPDAVRSIVAAHTPVPGAVIAKAHLPLFGEESLTGDQVQRYIDFLVTYKVLQAAAVPKGSAVVWAP
ncbi:ABC transporter substrate-binding protein [Galbitalea soli]|uniref:ABC transporter substrate-binding protein n=1 Tax=Galbitalea soli TaxID=1268042 RepID=A0A7C9PMM9_9MICO|nr:ABC transporter substrate-binding protein [Galbitalea soli]NEM91090.1 ABC transporter substrate-binding protein [Galbitalea soli]NYJ29778.1 NitT/TauT family transport system substrate-binding protein [Galbitalea soli]